MALSDVFIYNYGLQRGREFLRRIGEAIAAYSRDANTEPRQICNLESRALFATLQLGFSM